MTNINSRINEELKAAFQLLTSDDAAGFSAMLDQIPGLLRCTPAAFGESWLHLAAKSECLNVMEVLVQHGLSVDVADRDGDTALSAALAKPELRAARWLLEHGASAAVAGNGVLRSAIYSKNLAAVKLIVDGGADVNDQQLDSEVSVLDFARKYGTPEIIEYLISKGAKLATPKLSDFIIQHLDGQIGPLKSVLLSDSGVDIYAGHVPEGQQHVTLFTTGVGGGAAGGNADGRFIGLKIMLPTSWEADSAFKGSSDNGWPIEWLKTFAEELKSGRMALRDRFTVITNGEPQKKIAPAVGFTAFMLAKDPSPLFNFETGKGPVTYYTMFPLYPEEVALERNSDIPSLLNRFSEAGVGTIVIPDRINVALKGM